MANVDALNLQFVALRDRGCRISPVRKKRNVSRLQGMSSTWPDSSIKVLAMNRTHVVRLVGVEVG